MPSHAVGLSASLSSKSALGRGPVSSCPWLARAASARRSHPLRSAALAPSTPSGVMMNDHMNQVLCGNTLCSDGSDHKRSRRVIGKPLSPTALKSLQEEITSKAERLVERLVSKGTFCAITELATFLPMSSPAAQCKSFGAGIVAEAKMGGITKRRFK
jgi:hypothetical protein